jgi:hypothetical protein
VRLCRDPKQQESKNSQAKNPIEEKQPAKDKRDEGPFNQDQKKNIILPPGQLPQKKHADDKPSAAKSEIAEIHKEVSPAKGNVTLDNVKDAWQKMITNLSRIKMSVATYLNEGMPINIEGDVLTVSFSKNHSLHKESLEKKENRSLIESNLSAVLDAGLKVNFILSKDEKIAADIEKHPFVRSALDMFNARLINE